MVFLKSNWWCLSYGNTAHSPLSAHFLCRTWIWWGLFKVGDLGGSFYWAANQDNLVWLWNLISHYSSSQGLHPSRACLLIYSPNRNRLHRSCHTFVYAVPCKGCTLPSHLSWDPALLQDPNLASFVKLSQNPPFPALSPSLNFSPRCYAVTCM